MLLPVTLTIAAACAALNIWLAMRIVPSRVRGVSLGDGGDRALLARVRSHANLAEYAPFVLILLALIELGGGSPLWLWVAGVAFVLARIAHPFGMDRDSVNALRAGGAMVTWVVLALLAGWAVALALQAGGATTVTLAPQVAEAPRG